ncbi:response regulator transcription factor [Pseudoflavitalea sp. G-6-1-2]|uniref:LytR/AlgR family response regulator transcription factor n=1 Tax=Pseudoflavitalea sp. G-6-1-2 TaxID=2728841 RepID=UPI00146AEC07|nr:LytTR family DNA-binding domain-containing protein [Pseudoflavitalea sp. G-6-1-2]NML20003.1 response regulator transcription factor [Pseudoflavitalea sp. G-6-1-2]
MRKITCMIVEDEPPAMQLLEDHIAKVPYLQPIRKCYDGAEAAQFLSAHQCDLIFLDINMPQLNGIELAAMLPPYQKIIFTTAYSEHALSSFEFHVIDYLLKPISFKRFMQAINKLQYLTAPVSVAEKQTTEESHDFLFVKSGKQIHRINYAGIYFIEALKEYIAIHTNTGTVLVYKRMKEMAEQLPAEFVRIHNSYIINLQYIKSIEPGLVEIHNAKLPISNSYRDLFNQRISNRLI